jgi:hypothetical protein
MTDDEVKQLRLKHIEAMHMLGEAEDLHNRAEMSLAACPQSILSRITYTITRLALRVSCRVEADARANARKTYE